MVTKITHTTLSLSLFLSCSLYHPLCSLFFLISLYSLPFLCASLPLSLPLCTILSLALSLFPSISLSRALFYHYSVSFVCWRFNVVCGLLSNWVQKLENDFIKEC